MEKHVNSRTYRGLLAGVALAAAFLLPAGTSLAKIVTVTTTADSGPGSLRNAIAEASGGGTITFAPSVTGIITLTNGELAIGGNLTINGPGAGTLTVSGNNASRVFNIATNVTVSISGLTVSQGMLSLGAAYNGLATSGQGGGIYNAGNLALTDCTVSQNTVTSGAVFGLGLIGGDASGGGIYSLGTLSLFDCLITQNTALGGMAYDQGGQGFGGGVFSQGATLLFNCTLSQNAAIGGASNDGTQGPAGNGNGGGLYGLEQASLLVNCTIASNSASGGGGAGQFAALPGGVGSGGGVYVFGGRSSILLTSCTISGNTCTGSTAWGGGVFNPNQYAFVLQNTIISGNDLVANLAANPNVGGLDVWGVITSGGFNLIGATNGSSGWLADTNGADLVGNTNAPLDALLGPLQINGGPTPTMALPHSSPAVDQGYSFSITTDQRGLQRPVDYLGQPYPAGGDGSDIGAFELQRPVLSIAVVATENLASVLKLGWNESEANMSLSPMLASQPLYGVELSSDPTFSQAMPSMMPVWMRNGMYELRDTAVPTGAFYRLSTAVTNPFIPPAATMAATAINSNGATLNGTTTPYGLSTAYWFEYGADTNYGTCTPTNGLATSTNLASLSCDIGGLTPSTAVHFQLIVTDDDGTQLGGDQSFTTLANVPATPPPTVVSYAASAVGTSTATLNGSVNGNGLPVGAWFEYGLDTSYGSSTYNNQFFTSSDYSAAQAYSTPITGLAPNTTYHYRAIASSMAGQGSGADQTFTTAAGATQPPPTVSTLAASLVAETTADLNGSVNPNGANTTAYYEWGTDTTYGNTTPQVGIGTAPQGDLNTSLLGLDADTTYHYRIDAFNSGGTNFGADAYFTTAWAPVAPTLVSPGTATGGSPGLATTTPTFNWTGASPASSFDLIILDYPGGNEVFSASVGGTAYALPSGFLANATEYQWYMVAFNSLGDESSQSSPLYFTTAAAPTVVTLPETNGVGAVYAKLTGSVNPNGANTTAYFEYGTTTSYGTITTQTGIGTSAQTFSTIVNGLTAGITYHYRIDAVNGIGLSQGADVTFIAP